VPHGAGPEDRSPDEETAMKRKLSASPKLQLNRETLRALTRPELAGVEGGVSTRPCSAQNCVTDKGATCGSKC
jgi:hypothetical protein